MYISNFFLHSLLYPTKINEIQYVSMKVRNSCLTFKRASVVLYCLLASTEICKSISTVLNIQKWDQYGLFGNRMFSLAFELAARFYIPNCECCYRHTKQSLVDSKPSTLLVQSCCVCHTCVCMCVHVHVLACWCDGAYVRLHVHVFS